jgi:hypothetical protein
VALSPGRLVVGAIIGEGVVQNKGNFVLAPLAPVSRTRCSVAPAMRSIVR